MIKNIHLLFLASILTLSGCATPKTPQARPNASYIPAGATLIACDEIQAVPQKHSAHQVIILGRLGNPMGKIVRVEGINPPDGPKFSGASHFLVDTVDGKKLQEPCLVEFRGANEQHPGERHVFIGYETAGFASEPSGVAKYTGKSPQAGYAFRTEFLVIKDLTTTDGETGKLR